MDDSQTPVRDRPQIRLMRAIMRANALVRDKQKRAIEGLGVKFSEFDLIAALGNTDGMRMSDLARHMITSPSNVTRICTALEKQGLVERTRNCDSDREVIARLTAEGQELFDRVFLAGVRIATKMMSDVMSTPDQEKLAGMLEEFNQVLDEYDPAVLDGLKDRTD